MGIFYRINIIDTANRSRSRERNSRTRAASRQGRHRSRSRTGPDDTNDPQVVFGLRLHINELTSEKEALQLDVDKLRRKNRALEEQLEYTPTNTKVSFASTSSADDVSRKSTKVTTSNCECEKLRAELSGQKMLLDQFKTDWSKCLKAKVQDACKDKQTECDRLSSENQMLNAKYDALNERHDMLNKLLEQKHLELTRKRSGHHAAASASNTQIKEEAESAEIGKNPFDSSI